MLNPDCTGQAMDDALGDVRAVLECLICNRDTQGVAGEVPCGQCPECGNAEPRFLRYHEFTPEQWRRVLRNHELEG